jgi:hypothetical protein
MGSAAQKAEVVLIDTRRCSRCRDEKPVHAFHLRAPGKYRSECRVCRSAGRRTRPVPPAGMKSCPCCLDVLPTGMFYGRPDGSLHSWCVNCESDQKKGDRGVEAERRQARALKEAAAVMAAGEKTCPKCRERLPLDSFAPDSSRLDGRSRRCRVCVKLRSDELDAEDAERAHRWERVQRERQQRFAALVANGRPGDPALSEDTGEDEIGRATVGHRPPEVPRFPE